MLNHTSDIEMCLPSHTNVAVVIVTYCPDDSFIHRLRLVGDQFKLVVVVDNSVQTSFLGSQLESEKIRLIRNQENVGLAEALNIGCQAALELGFEWVVTLDQDTELGENYLCKMLAAWSASALSPAILGCNYYNVARSHYKFTPTVAPFIQTRKTVITSGCLMNLSIWSNIGGFRGDYFIDSVDHEFCLRARIAGFCVAVNLQSLMVHQIGEAVNYHKLLKKYSPYSHSVSRVYTKTRNTLRTAVDYFSSEPVWCIKQLCGLSVDLLAIVFFESDKKIRLRAFGSGLADGCSNKMGDPPIRYYRE